MTLIARGEEKGGRERKLGKASLLFRHLDIPLPIHPNLQAKRGKMGESNRRKRKRRNRMLFCLFARFLEKERQERRGEGHILRLALTPALIAHRGEGRRSKGEKGGKRKGKEGRARQVQPAPFSYFDIRVSTSALP